MVEQVWKRLTRDDHAQIISMGEVRLRHVSRLRRLTEYDVTLWPVQRPPLPYPPLQGAPDAIIGESQGVQTLKMAQQSHRLQPAVLLQERKQVTLPISFERVRDGAPMRDLAVGR